MRDNDRAPQEKGADPEPDSSNRYDRFEWAGAFGDLGTLIPFVAAYVASVGMDPFGVLFAFGVAMVAVGLRRRTPFPVQPMKALAAVAATQAAQSATVTPSMVQAAGLVTGALWLVIGLTGAAARLAALIAPPVVAGIVLGLGMGFVAEGAKLMSEGWALAAVCGVLALLLMNQRRFPAMFALLLLGAVGGLASRPELAHELAGVGVGFRAPALSVSGISWSDLAAATVLLALPQMPLTLGNAVVAIKQENNRLFPDRPVTERGVAISTGCMNLFSGAVGGVPMCHGAGGMAGHVAFGARTGGSVVILGGVLLVLALFFSGSVAVLFKLFPAPVLGVILAISGAQLAAGSGGLPESRGARIVTLVTAAFCLWNVAIGVVVGLGLHEFDRRGLLKL